MQAVRRTVTIAGNLAFALMLMVMVTMVFYVVKAKLDGGVPSVAGYKLYTVLSGSMNPTFDTGSVIAVKNVDTNNIKVGDIITFRDPEDANRIVSHRVVEIKKENGSRSFVTKGDANDVRDTAPVPASSVIGRANYWVPYMGYLTEFARTKRGLLLLIVLPGALFIVSELRNLFKYAREYEEEEKRKKAETHLGGVKTEI